MDLPVAAVPTLQSASSLAPLRHIVTSSSERFDANQVPGKVVRKKIGARIATVIDLNSTALPSGSRKYSDVVGP